jgi:Clostripain family
MHSLRIAAGLALVALLSVFAAPAQADPERTAAGDQEHGWVLVYVMSYDNNLERCGPIILQGLLEGTRGTDVVVTVLADFTDTDGLQRFVFRDGEYEVEVLETDDCASEQVMVEYFDWVAEEFPAERYGMVFLNHGGNLDDMCLDEQPGGGSRKVWLSAAAMGPVMRDFRESAPGEVELLFLQQCGRGSLDNLYNFRGAARAVMASQTTVGAPNTYYTPSVQWLAGNQDIDGFALADRIMGDDEHYTNYVCVDGEALEALPEHLDRMVDALLDSGATLTAPSMTPCFGGQGRGAETSFDALGFFTGLAESASSSRVDRALEGFRTYYEEELIRSHRKQARQAGRIRDWTGIAVWVPVERRVRGRYDGYPLYEDSRLDELWGEMYPRR